MTPLRQEYQYTYADLLEWDEDIRYELYDGIPVALASPTNMHQEISGNLYLQLGLYLKRKKSKAYYAPFDVRLFEKNGDHPEDVNIVVQPDLMVVCNPEQVDWHGIHGAPDLVIVILSDSTRRIDRLIKFNLYQRAGVREYWLVDPAARNVSVYTLEDSAYHTSSVYDTDSSIRVSVLDNCIIDLSAVF